MKQKNILNIILILILIVIVGCTTIPTEKGTYEKTKIFDPANEIKAKAFSSISEFNEFVKKPTSEAQFFGGGVMMGRTDVVMETVAAVSEKGIEVPEAAPSDYSETNIQVKGVDEADIIKTDGNYIYTISGNTLFIIKAYPGEDAEVISKLKFDQTPNNLFINDDKLAVFGNFYDLDFFKKIDFIPRQGMTFFNIYDISNKESPKLEKEYKFEGNYFQARMIEDYVYFITTTWPQYRTEFPTPLIIEGTVKRSIAVEDIFYYPIPYQSTQFANIHAIKIIDSDKDVESKTITVEGSQNMYMSENNIYITYTKYINEWELQRQITINLIEPQLTGSDKELIEKIKATDNEVLSQAEKENKIYQIIQTYINYMGQQERDELEDKVQELLEKKLEEYEYMEFTLIHKISVDGDNIEIVADGQVPGNIINQFSMDENKDIFRIAATISARWSSFGKQRTESTNNIYTLDADLEILDKLEGLAESERIYSTRFMGDRLYMVTFRQTDPFFVIDLSNPYSIKELGQLKIPGFSRYLHPYDKDTIIGIGRDATETGRTRGLKISLFDVADVENPKETANFITKERYSQSTAEFEHKAFLFSKDKELLVIPVYNQDYMWDEETSESYNGAMVFKITKNEIELRGIVDHSMASGKSYGPLVERSLYIEELLYTKSPTLLRINKIENLEKVKNIELESDSSYTIY